MNEFLKKYKNKWIRYWTKKRMWTPYDMEIKNPDQSDLNFEECSHGYIVEAYNLGYDWLVGIGEEPNSSRYISFYKLSELDMAYSEADQEEEIYE